MVFYQTLSDIPRTLGTCRIGPFCDTFVSFLKSLMMITIHCQLYGQARAELSFFFFLEKERRAYGIRTTQG